MSDQQTTPTIALNALKQLHWVVSHGTPADGAASMPGERDAGEETHVAGTTHFPGRVMGYTFFTLLLIKSILFLLSILQLLLRSSFKAIVPLFASFKF